MEHNLITSNHKGRPNKNRKVVPTFPSSFLRPMTGWTKPSWWSSLCLAFGIFSRFLVHFPDPSKVTGAKGGWTRRRRRSRGWGPLGFPTSRAFHGNHHITILLVRDFFRVITVDDQFTFCTKRSPYFHLSWRQKFINSQLTKQKTLPPSCFWPRLGKNVYIMHQQISQNY